jgi:adenine-specific DNA-methyltransferase
MTDRLAIEWSSRFGLARSPLFESGEIDCPDRHTVLLDGGTGSFILSEGSQATDRRSAASWAWSSAMPNHVAVSNDDVVVTRWDAPESRETFTLRSVNERLQAFYSYLTKKRTSSRPDVVATLLDLFRAVRGEVEAAGASDDERVSEFLELLAVLVESEQQPEARDRFSAIWRTGRVRKAEPVLDDDRRHRLEAGFKSQISTLFGLEFSGALAVRHAASAIFQEAHFTFQSSPQTDLFGHQPTTSVAAVTRGAHHFTPPSLARSIVEQALASMPDVARRKRLVVCDPACGSGAFLTETARTLRRLGFEGALELVGRDLSPSAVAMAEFALNAAKFDWQPAAGMDIDVKVANALEPYALPASDLVVMNPPFLAWPMMAKDQREQVSELLAGAAKHRPDLSMAFVTRALATVDRGGVLATLLPASILALDSGQAWRRDLLAKARPSFLGYFGDYGLFIHALVQVAALVLVVGDNEHSGLALRSSRDASATSEAIRALRRLSGPIISDASGKGWRITPIDRRDLVKHDRWRILPARTVAAIRRLAELGMPTVEEIFDVKQGILTGLNEAFILSRKELDALPTVEARYFRPALFRDALSDGVIRDSYFVFFPYEAHGLLFASEESARRHLPVFFDRYLDPRRDKLERRSGIDADSRPWWALARYYQWVQRPDPRILSKYFGTIGDFALDEESRIVPLQGYAWFLKSQRLKGELEKIGVGGVLRAYFSLLNSTTFSRLLKVFSDSVQGGQFNLSARFVRPIPLPDLRLDKNLEVATQLISLSQASDRLSQLWLRRVEVIAASLWGDELVSALTEVDDA